MPIKKSNDIYEYFNNNYPLEFIGYSDFDGIKDYMADRVRYFHFLDNNFKKDNEAMNQYIYNINLQKKLGVNRLEDESFELRVGSNWFSITSNLAKYVLSKEKLIKEKFSYGYCADELFLQSIVYNSKYFKNVCKLYKDDNENCKRLIDWKRGNPYVFTKNDYDEVISSTAMFARKFSTSVDKDIIDMIYNRLK